MPTIHVSVTAEDIAEGKRCSFTSCPHALAIRRAWGEVISVGPYTVRLFSHRTVPLPSKARAHILAFDASMPVQPIEYDLELP